MESLAVGAFCLFALFVGTSIHLAFDIRDALRRVATALETLPTRVNEPLEVVGTSDLQPSRYWTPHRWTDENTSVIQRASFE